MQIFDSYVSTNGLNTPLKDICHRILKMKKTKSKNREYTSYIPSFKSTSRRMNLIPEVISEDISEAKRNGDKIN